MRRLYNPTACGGIQRVENINNHVCQTRPEAARRDLLQPKTVESKTVNPAETLDPLHHRKPEHIAMTRIPEGTELSPIAIFSLYWEESVLRQIVDSTNAYAESKRHPDKRFRPWKPTSVGELRQRRDICRPSSVVRPRQNVSGGYWQSSSYPSRLIVVSSVVPMSKIHR